MKIIKKYDTRTEEWNMTLKISHVDKEKWKKERTKEIKLQNQEGIKTLGEKEITSTWDYWMWKPSNKPRWKKKKETSEKKYLSGKYLIKEINIYKVVLVRCTSLFLKCTREEIKLMNKKTWKLMAINKALYPSDDEDRQHVKEQEEDEYIK